MSPHSKRSTGFGAFLFYLFVYMKHRECLLCRHVKQTLEKADEIHVF
jgi:hypothetical protein